MRSKTSRLVGLAAFLTIGAVSGCADRLHLTSSHGRAYRAAFERQPANPDAGRKAKPLPGLDAQEAGIVAGNYRRSLVSKDPQTTNDQGMLILGAPKQSAPSPYLPPPSVPQERR